MVDFSPDSVLLVLTCEINNEVNYIRDYDEFLEYVKNCGEIVCVWRQTEFFHVDLML